MDKKISVMLKNILMVALLLVLLLPAGLVLAQEGAVIDEDINKTAGDLEIDRGTTVNGNVTLNVGELKVLGIVNGNVNSNMGQVIVDGDVNGNVETNMGRIVINGNVSGNVKTRMGEVVIDGSVGGNLDTDLGAAQVGGSIGGDIGSGFGELRVDGTVAGDINSKAGNIVINGIVEGDVILEQGVVELGPDAIVSGRIVIERGLIRKASTAVTGAIEIEEEISAAELEEPVSPEGYRFDGIDGNFVDEVADRIVREVNQGLRGVEMIPHMSRDWSFPRLPFSHYYGSTARSLINMLIMFALAALTYSLFPKQVKRTGLAVTAKPGPVIGWGILVAVLAIPLMILLAITIIGIPLVIIEILFLALAGILGYSGITLLIGERIIGAASGKTTNPLGAVAIGVLIVGLIGLVPIIGGLISLTVFILAIGAVLVTRFGSHDPEVVETAVAVPTLSDDRSEAETNPEGSMDVNTTEAEKAADQENQADPEGERPESE